jgi:hypothetical protein
MSHPHGLLYLLFDKFDESLVVGLGLAVGLCII